VLTIEDDETTASDIAVELRKRGFSVDWVNNGREGIARAMSDEYDIITNRAECPLAFTASRLGRLPFALFLARKMRGSTLRRSEHDGSRCGK